MCITHIEILPRNHSVRVDEQIPSFSYFDEHLPDRKLLSQRRVEFLFEPLELLDVTVPQHRFNLFFDNEFFGSRYCLKLG